MKRPILTTGRMGAIFLGYSAIILVLYRTGVLPDALSACLIGGFAFGFIIRSFFYVPPETKKKKAR